MGTIYSKKTKCGGMSPYVLGYDNCDINRYHTHCEDIIPESKIICNNPIYWWQRRCNNNRCNSVRHIYSTSEVR